MAEQQSKIREGRCAIVMPLANEAATLHALFTALSAALSELPEAVVITVLDKASRDETYKMCLQQAEIDRRFVVHFATESKSVVDAYLAGFKQALALGADCIIEMDGGLAHNPKQIKEFYTYWQLGHDAVFSTRFSKGGALLQASLQRRVLSKGGTVLGNLFLGTRFSDMTSGFEAFDSRLLTAIVNYPLKSKAHFFQTEIRFLCRHANYCELPIIHTKPAESVRLNAITNALNCLAFYFVMRLKNQAPSLK